MMKNTQNSDLFQRPQKRKYTKHDYFADLNKKLRIWKSILTEATRIGTFYKKHSDIDLSGVQEEVLKCIIDIDKREGKLLSSSEKIQKLYVDAQELLNQEGKAKKIFDEESHMPNIMRHFDCNLFIERINELFQDRIKQKQRIQCIQALLKHEKKQFQLETRIKEQTFGKKTQNGNPYGNIPTEFERSVIRRIDELRKRIIKDEKEVHEIERELQRRAKDFILEGNNLFSKDVVQRFIKECQAIYPELEKALVSDYKLKKKLETALTQLKKTVEQEKIRIAQEKTISRAKEKTPEEKIQSAFNSALEIDKNLILIGKYRSLGLTNSVIKEINEDDEYKQDTIEHILGLLNTPQGQDFVRSGSTRWRPVQGRELYELSVNPKLGHRQNMPRLYAKKELFIQNETVLELKDEENAKSIWVLVRKGSKRTQANDVNFAEKVFFENDGKVHRGQIVLNSLGWIKMSIIPDGVLPTLSVVKIKGRG